jgi:hypothetical protein
MALTNFSCDKILLLFYGKLSWDSSGSKKLLRSSSSSSWMSPEKTDLYCRLSISAIFLGPPSSPPEDELSGPILDLVGFFSGLHKKTIHAAVRSE